MGLMLAGGLALAGVDVSIVERRPDQALAGSREFDVTGVT
jgi:3-(3-hydroxy-phenyl)propionate hydroxylase